jgi:hypothetical protein
MEEDINLTIETSNVLIVREGIGGISSKDSKKCPPSQLDPTPLSSEWFSTCIQCMLLCKSGVGSTLESEIEVSKMHYNESCGESVQMGIEPRRVAEAMALGNASKCQFFQESLFSYKRFVFNRG